MSVRRLGSRFLIIVIVGWMLAPAGHATPPAGQVVAGGFHLEPAPEFAEVFGDAEQYRQIVDRFFVVAERMQQRRDDFARAVQNALARLNAPSQPSTTSGAPRVCPEAALAVAYARALRRGNEYLRAGRELARHYDQIKELDRLGETTGLTPDYRARVRRAIELYQSLLVDYREMKVSFHDQLAGELRYANCDPQRLLARAEAGGVKDPDGPWPEPGDPASLGSAAPITAHPTLSGDERRDTAGRPLPSPSPAVAGGQERASIFIFIDNLRCERASRVFIDGKFVAEVPAATRTALKTSPGPHDLCLIAAGSDSKCGDAGTLRRSYWHDGWTIALRCE